MALTVICWPETNRCMPSVVLACCVYKEKEVILDRLDPEASVALNLHFAIALPGLGEVFTYRPGAGRTFPEEGAWNRPRMIASSHPYAHAWLDGEVNTGSAGGRDGC